MVGGEGGIGFKGKAEEDFGEQEVGPLPGVDEAGVFADPAQACALCEVAFEDGASIGVVTVRNRMPYLIFEKLDESGKPRGNEGVVVYAPGIAGNAPTQGGGCCLGWGLSGWVANPQHQDTRTVWQNLARIGAADAGALMGQIGHFTMKPGVQPAFVLREVEGGVGGGDTYELKTETPGFVFEGLGESKIIRLMGS